MNKSKNNRSRQIKNNTAENYEFGKDYFEKANHCNHTDVDEYGGEANEHYNEFANDLTTNAKRKNKK